MPYNVCVRFCSIQLKWILFETWPITIKHVSLCAIPIRMNHSYNTQTITVYPLQIQARTHSIINTVQRLSAMLKYSIDTTSIFTFYLPLSLYRLNALADWIDAFVDCSFSHIITRSLHFHQKINVHCEYQLCIMLLAYSTISAQKGLR